MLGIWPLVSTQSIVAAVVANSTLLLESQCPVRTPVISGVKCAPSFWITEQPSGQDSHQHGKSFHKKIFLSI